jgi:hypothetical protein
MSNNLLRDVLPTFIKSSKLLLLWDEENEEQEAVEDDNEGEDEDQYNDFWYSIICLILCLSSSVLKKQGESSSFSSVISDVILFSEFVFSRFPPSACEIDKRQSFVYGAKKISNLDKNVGKAGHNRMLFLPSVFTKIQVWSFGHKNTGQRWLA